MTDIRSRLLFLAEQHPEVRGRLLELAHMGVGEGVPYRQDYFQDDDYGYSSEMMADAKKRNLKNPISTSCTPIQRHEHADPNPTKRDSGDCYQRHHEYGSGVSKNKSEYMKKYRELQKAQGVTHAPDGKYGDPDGRPQGKRPNPNQSRGGKTASKKKLPLD